MKRDAQGKIRDPAGKNGIDRKALDGILTFEAASGERITLAEKGSRLVTLAMACDYVLTLDPSYRLIAYSTPETIFADLDGARADYQTRQSNGSETTTRPVHPELTCLSRVKRRHMLHPRLERSGR